MPFNGTGVFTRVYSWTQDAANSINIRADRMDTEMNGFATGLSNCMTRDGEAPPLANLPMGSYKLTGLGLGANPGESLAYEQFYTNTALIGGAWTFSNSITFNGAVSLNGTSTALTATAGDSTTKIATTAFVQSTAFSAALPAQTGNAGKVVTTNGSTASWAVPTITAADRPTAALIQAMAGAI